MCTVRLLACIGFCTAPPLLAADYTFPAEFPYTRYKIILLDRKKMPAKFAPGIELPLHPFFGSMGVAPAGGEIDSAPPFAHAGQGNGEGALQRTSAMTKGLVPVCTVGVLSGTSEPSATMAYCDTVLSVMLTTYAYSPAASRAIHAGPLPVAIVARGMGVSKPPAPT
ncbi:MAG: hypothetical protein ACYDBZ_17870, partial [Steroidobacteraceae bacterium]